MSIEKFEPRVIQARGLCLMGFLVLTISIILSSVRPDLPMEWLQIGSGVSALCMAGACFVLGYALRNRR